MAKYSTDRIRNVAVLGHGGSGKTTLTEALLFKTGVTTRIGRVEDGTTVADWEPEEQRRGLSINLSVIPIEYENLKINLIDTPGYLDFSGEQISALHVAEAGLILVDAVAGAEVGTELAWDTLNEQKCPRIIFVNKMDRENANYEHVIDSLHTTLGNAKIIPMQLPIGQADTFRGVISLVTMKAYMGKESKEAPIPEDMLAAAEAAHTAMAEAAAETDDDLIVKYLDGEDLDPEEVRHALLIAFTSREARFNRLGINVTDERWPVGRVPAVICPDRGSDFMSESMEQSVVNNLRIDLTPLPPLCPDGKAIVERLIREIKRRMAASGIEGVYADRPMDPRTKRAARKAAAAAVRTLSEAYRLLVDIVVDHNNRPHSTLRRRRVLTQAGVQPTPREAYLWGLQHMTGLRSAPLSEDDYHRLLLSTDKASIANGVLRYKSRPYVPDNEQAAELALHSTRRPRPVDIRLDKTLPTQILVPNVHGTWARFQMSGGVANEIAGMSLDEEEAMSGHTALLWARADHQGRVARVAASTSKRRSSNRAAAEGPAPGRGKVATGTPAVAQLSRAEQIAARNKETARMKASLHGKPLTPSTDADSQEASSTPDWRRVEEEERQRNLALIKKHRNRR